MKFSLLLPTLGEKPKELRRLFDSLEMQEYKIFEIIIVSQSNFDLIDEIINEYNFQYKHIKIEKKGISIARNEGLKHISGDILHLTDDDCWFHKDSLKNVYNNIIEKNPDIITFKSYDPILNKYPKQFHEKEIMGLSKRFLLKQVSYDIYTNLNKVKVEDLKFDERFGVGQVYNSGEENIYLMDLYNKGYKNICYIPEIIAYHPIKNNLYLEGMSFVAKAPLFKRLFGNIKGFPIFLLFAIKKKKFIDNYYFWLKKAIKEYLVFNI